MICTKFFRSSGRWLGAHYCTVLVLPWEKVRLRIGGHTPKADDWHACGRHAGTTVKRKPWVVSVSFVGVLKQQTHSYDSLCVNIVQCGRGNNWNNPTTFIHFRLLLYSKNEAQQLLLVVPTPSSSSSIDEPYSRFVLFFWFVGIATSTRIRCLVSCTVGKKGERVLKNKKSFGVLLRLANKKIAQGKTYLTLSLFSQDLPTTNNSCKRSRKRKTVPKNDKTQIPITYSIPSCILIFADLYSRNKKQNHIKNRLQRAAKR